jgi:hypothetical protein
LVAIDAVIIAVLSCNNASILPSLRERAPYIIVEGTALEKPGCPAILRLFSSWRSAA